MPTTVIHIKDRQPGDIYIGRAGKGEDGYFGNPFVIPKDGDRDEVLRKFAHWFLGKVACDLEYRQRVLALQGKRLCCFCKPLPCHGDVIANWLNYQSQKEV